MPDLDQVGRLIDQARDVAIAYKRLTGRPLGITGEVAEFEAARILGLELAEARAPGYDALRGEVRIQIKGRVVGQGSKPGQRIGAIKLDHPWDVVLFVALGDDLRPTGIWEADRASVMKAIGRTESKARRRGALALSEFRSISRQIWPA